jgi:hypothetical protein
MSRMVEIYLHSPIFLNELMLNELSTRTTLPFTYVMFIRLGLYSNPGKYMFIFSIASTPFLGFSYALIQCMAGTFFSGLKERERAMTIDFHLLPSWNSPKIYN